MNYDDPRRELSYDVRVIVDSMTQWLYNEYRGVVQGGPFAGLQLLPEIVWPQTALVPMLLGCYEEELQPFIECQITRLARMEAPKVVNVGCAEGYYAVGLAKRLPRAEVWAIDINEKALEHVNKSAKANAVNMIIDSNEKPADFLNGADFIVMDAEGAEVLYLNPLIYEGLKTSTILVEIHYLADQDVPVDQKMVERFGKTHRISMIYEGPRYPAKYPALHKLMGYERWLAMNEMRGGLMHWLEMVPR